MVFFPSVVSDFHFNSGGNWRACTWESSPSPTGIQLSEFLQTQLFVYLNDRKEMLATKKHFYETSAAELKMWGW